MDTSFFKMLFAMLLCLLHAQVSIHGFNNSLTHVECIESERQALLNFKQSLIDEYGMLSTWTNNTDCCKWNGIHCNNQTGHVQMLHLRGQVDAQHLKGAIDITSLIALTNLQHLDLSNNNFVESQIPQLIGSFTNLRYLDLSFSAIGGSIPSELENLSQLRYLDLQRNYLNGTIPSQLGNLTQLRYLDLQWNPLDGTIPSQLGKLTSLRCLRLGGSFDLKINDAKWLTSLSSLTTLDLDGFPNLPSSIFLENFNFSSKLRELYLTDCDLTDKSFLVSSSSIKSSVSSLVTLDLSYNQLKSSAIFHWILNFTTSLHSLNLGENLLEGRIPEGLEKVMNFLAVLDLNSNKLQGEIPAFLGNICTLQELFLNYNNLSGQISSFIHNSSRCNKHVFQTSLRILDLSYNKLQGEIPAFLGNICTLQELHLHNNNMSGEISSFIINSSRCNRHAFQTSLWRLDLSNNHFTGEIPKSIGLLHELESLHLQENHLKGNINELHFTNLSKLKDLDLTDNSLSLTFDTTWVPPFQLYSLGLASCHLGPNFPSWLQSQHGLSFLDISDAGIDDSVPEWFWYKLHSISEMNMSYNSLKGTIPNLPIKFTHFPSITLKSNELEAEIPAFLSQADSLDLSKNKFSKLNTFLCGKGATINLRILDLSNNEIMGELPDCWEHIKRSLTFLDLSNNRLSGKIPQSIGTLVNLEALILRNNSLTGGLPFPLKNCTRLVIFDLSTNLLSGPIPSWIGESLQQLSILSLRINHFIGVVPVNLCYLNQINLLDLSRNHLSGGIPSCLRNFTTMMNQITPMEPYLDLYESNVLLMWKGQEQVFFNPEIFLKSIDLSSNDLTGEIPKEVGYLLGLVSLNLARNKLHGEIPLEIGNLNKLDFLDLSRNHLSGRIPSTLSKIDDLGYLNLSYNDLCGRIPWEGHLETFDGSSFEGNVGLCGKQLNKACPGDKTTVQEPQGKATDGEDENSVLYEGLYMSLGFGFLTGFWSLLGSILVWQRWRISYMRFLNTLTDYILLTLEVNCHRWLKH